MFAAGNTPAARRPPTAFPRGLGAAGPLAKASKRRCRVPGGLGGLLCEFFQATANEFGDVGVGAEFTDGCGDGG